MSERLASLLREWGATRVDTFPDNSYREADTNVEFHTPFPGDQPIRSNISVADGRVVKATIRYGVLQRGRFEVHPTQSIDHRFRLIRCAQNADQPDTGYVMVNFGDEHRVPRPHILYGWGANMDVETAEFNSAFQTDRDANAPVGDFFRYIKTTGREIRSEFEEDYVE